MQFNDDETMINRDAGTAGLGERVHAQLAGMATVVSAQASRTAKAITQGMAPDNMPSASLLAEARRQMQVERSAASLASDLVCSARKMMQVEDSLEPSTGGGEPGGGVDPPLPGFSWSTDAGWASREFADEHMISEPRTSIVVAVDATNENGIAASLAYAAGKLDEFNEAARSQVDIVIEVPAGTYKDFSFAFGSRWNPLFVSGSIFDARSVNIVGPNPRRTAMHDAQPGGKPLCRIIPAVTIEPGRPKPGGDTINISAAGGDGINVRAFAKLRLFGVQVNCAGRAAIHPSTGQPFILEAAACHIGEDAAAVAADTDMKWLLQCYLASPRLTDVSFDAPSIQEHLVYTHGHADGVDMWMRRCMSDGNGGQVLQCTERAYEVPDAGAQFFDVDDCVFTGFHKFAGRAGSAITFAGSGLHGRMTNTVVIDDDPTDTSHQQGSTVGTNYGALTVWNVQDPSESYAEQSGGGYGNASFHATGCVFAIRNGNRALASLHDARSLRIRSSLFLGAPAEDGEHYNAAGAQVVHLNTEMPKKKPIPHVDVDLTEAPPAFVTERFHRIALNGERSSYVPVFWEYGNAMTQSNGATFRLKGEFDEFGTIIPSTVAR